MKWLIEQCIEIVGWIIALALMFALGVIAIGLSIYLIPIMLGLLFFGLPIIGFGCWIYFKIKKKKEVVDLEDIVFDKSNVVELELPVKPDFYDKYEEEYRMDHVENMRIRELSRQTIRNSEEQEELDYLIERSRTF